VAQQEAATVVGLDLEIAVGGVVPSVEDRDHGEPARAEVEDMGLRFAAPAGTSVNANLHDAVFPFDPPLACTCKEPATRHAPFGGCAPYLAIVLVSALATFSPGTECWQAHSPSAAATKRTLAKLTDFMARHSTSDRVMDLPERDGSYGA
jgi:hypothetical protein